MNSFFYENCMLMNWFFLLLYKYIYLQMTTTTNIKTTPLISLPMKMMSIVKSLVASVRVRIFVLFFFGIFLLYMDDDDVYYCAFISFNCNLFDWFMAKINIYQKYLLVRVWQSAIKQTSTKQHAAAMMLLISVIMTEMELPDANQRIIRRLGCTDKERRRKTPPLDVKRKMLVTTNGTGFIYFMSFFGIWSAFDEMCRKKPKR